MSVTSTSTATANLDNVQTYVWSEKITIILTIIRIQSEYLSRLHNYKYEVYKLRLKYFRIPIIFLSAINAFTAIGIQGYTAQRNISMINSVLSFICGVITSVELFLNVQQRMEKELLSHKSFSLLSLDIFKMLSLEVDKRNVDGRSFLDEKFAEFQKHLQNSNSINTKYYTKYMSLDSVINPPTLDTFNDDMQMFDRLRKYARPMYRRYCCCCLYDIVNAIYFIYNRERATIEKYRKQAQEEIEFCSKKLIMLSSKESTMYKPLHVVFNNGNGINMENICDYDGEEMQSKLTLDDIADLLKQHIKLTQSEPSPESTNSSFPIDIESNIQSNTPPDTPFNTSSTQIVVVPDTAIDDNTDHISVRMVEVEVNAFDNVD